MYKFGAPKTSSTVKHPPPEREKAFSSHVSDKGLIYRIYRELLTLSNNKKNPIQKGGKTRIGISLKQTHK